MPDLDLIMQATQGEFAHSARPIPSPLDAYTKTATKTGDFAADLLQEQRTSGWHFNEWL